MKRWLKRLFFAAIIGTFVIIGGFYLYLFAFGGLERTINQQIQALVKPEYKFDVTVGKIKGNFFSGIELEHIVTYYVDSSASYVMAQIPRLSLNYSIKNLWNRNYIFETIRLDSTSITLREDSTGRLLIPDFSPPEKSDKETVIPSFAFEELIISGLDLNLIRRSDSLLLSDVSINLALRVEEGTYSLSVKQMEYTSNKETFSLKEAGGKLTYSNKTFLFERLTFVSDSTRLKLNGNVHVGDLTSGEVKFNVDNLNLENLTKYIGPKLRGMLDLNGSVTLSGGRVQGRVDLAGDFMIMSFKNMFVDFRFEDKVLYLDTLYGTFLEKCGVDGFGQIDFSQKPEKYNLSARIKNFNLKQLVKNSYESDLTGDIELRGESFKNKSLKLIIQTDLYESTFDEYPIQRANGEMIITTDSISFTEPFIVEYYENRFEVDGRVDYRDEINLNIRSYLDNLDRYRGKLFIDQPAGRAYSEATLTGKTSDPDLRGYLVSDSLWLYGLSCDSMYSTFDIDRFLTGRDGEVTADFSGGAVWDLPYDSGFAHILLDSNIATFDSTFIIDPSYRMSARGDLDSEAQPRRLTVDTLDLTVFDHRFGNRGPLEFRIDSVGFEMLKTTIGSNGALISADGRIDFDERMNFNLLVEQVQLGPWVNLFKQEWAIGGLISGDADMSGSFINPQWQLTGRVDSLTYRDLVLGDLAADLSFENSFLTIDSLTINSHPGRYYADGSMAIDLALTSDSLERFPELPMNIHITAEDNRFDLVSLVMPSVEQLDGDFAADFRLTGTPLDPHLEGGAGIKSARLKYFDLRDPIKADDASVTMEDNRIVIDEIELYTDSRGKRRYAYLDGEIMVKSLDNLYYDLDVRLPREFPFTYELDDIRGVVEGDMHIEGDTPPLVTGDLALISTRYEVNFAEADEGSPIMLALEGENAWDLNINIEMISNYWIKNEDINAEFSGNINIIRRDGQYRFLGEMEIRRGRGFLFDKTFRLEPGSRVIFEGNETLNPRLDITAYTKITTTSEALIGQEEKTYDQINVGVRITGTLENPEFYPSDDSDVQNREDLFPLLIANYYSSERGTASGSFGRRVAGLLSSQASQIGSKQLGRIGVETFEIDPTYEGQIDLARTKVTLGFYPGSSNLYLYGRSDLSGKSGQEIGFEYQFIKNVLLEGRKDEDDLYRLLIKLFWELK